MEEVPVKFVAPTSNVLKLPSIMQVEFHTKLRWERNIMHVMAKNKYEIQKQSFSPKEQDWVKFSSIGF